MKVLVVIALVGVVLFALAWWRSGRSPGADNRQAIRERTEAEAKAMKEYRPTAPRAGF